jgi:hypothetical protein
MKKRIRKKLHLKEFAEYGIEFEIAGNAELTSAEFDTIMDRFIFEFVEGNDLYCYGGWSAEKNEANFIVQIGKKKESFELYVDKMRNWLESEQLYLLKEFTLIDLWYPG